MRERREREKGKGGRKGDRQMKEGRGGWGGERGMNGGKGGGGGQRESTLAKKQIISITL